MCLIYLYKSSSQGHSRKQKNPILNFPYHPICFFWCSLCPSRVTAPAGNQMQGSRSEDEHLYKNIISNDTWNSHTWLQFWPLPHSTFPILPQGKAHEQGRLRSRDSTQITAHRPMGHANLPWSNPFQVWAVKWDEGLHYADPPWCPILSLPYLQCRFFHLRTKPIQGLSLAKTRSSVKITSWSSRRYKHRICTHMPSDGRGSPSCPRKNFSINQYHWPWGREWPSLYITHVPSSSATNEASRLWTCLTKFLAF